VLPVSDWRVNPQLLGRPGRHYVSPDGTTFLPADSDFVSGALSWGVKSSALLRSFGLAAAAPGKPAYLTSEAEIATYQATVAPDGSLSNFKLFANQGGESVTVDAKGNVYIAAGQIYVYSPEGKLLDTIDVPERPLQLVFGGPDGKTLFIPARTSLYAIR
jgi:sugar lactone lactonase YvrE